MRFSPRLVFEHILRYLLYTKILYNLFHKKSFEITREILLSPCKRTWYPLMNIAAIFQFLACTMNAIL